MSYVQKTLGPGEELRFRAHFNWTYDAAAWFWLWLGAAPLALTIYLYFQSPPDRFADDAGSYVFSALALALGFILWLTPMVHKWTTEIAVTNQRFVYKQGLISRHTQELALARIEEINFTQSFWGRIFGYGRLTIRGTGVGVFELPNLDNPVKLRSAIQVSRNEARNDN